MAYNYKTQPYKHQFDALEKAAHQVEWAFFMDMGTGKTKTTIDNIGILYHERKINSAVVVAPKSVYLNWGKEINNHLSDDINFHVHMWNVTKTKKFNPFKNKLAGTCTILLMNVEALSSGRGQEALENYLRINQHTFFAIDESTTIKNPTAKRTKCILKLSKLAKYRRILTGSPVTKSPLDLYTQCAFLNPALLGFKSYYSFRSRYAEMHTIFTGPDRQVIVPKYYKNLDELEFKLKQFSTRIRKDECLDLPPKVYRQRWVSLGEKQRAFYDRFKANAIAILEDSTVSFTNKLTEILRLHQVCNGFVNDDNGDKVELENPKMRELDAVLDETNGKVIIWANYLHNIHDINAHLLKKYGKGSVVVMYGDVSLSQRQEAIKQFQENDNCRFFVANPQTGGHGLTLTAANTVVYFSNNYNLELRLQSEDRAHRIGQTKSVTYIDLIVENTVDEKIVEALVNKNKLAGETLGEEIKSWLK